MTRVYFEDIKFEVPSSDVAEERLAKMIALKIISKAKAEANNNLNKSTY